jgi:hypothetical protein
LLGTARDQKRADHQYRLQIIFLIVAPRIEARRLKLRALFSVGGRIFFPGVDDFISVFLDDVLNLLACNGV